LIFGKKSTTYSPSTTVQLSVPFLTTKSLNLRHDQASNAALCKCFPDLFEFKRLDDGCNLLQKISPVMTFTLDYARNLLVMG
jgi:hypothetical protein